MNPEQKFQPEDGQTDAQTPANQLSHEQINNPEDENRPHYSVIIVLGTGLIKEVDPTTGEERVVLDQDGKVRSMASGLLAQELDVPEVIYTGGKTLGPDYPSEAEKMYEYAKRLYPDLGKRTVVLEEKAWDTSTNAEFVADIMNEEQTTGSAILLTSESHLERADYHFLRHGIDATPMSAEAVTARRSPHHEKYIREKLKSKGNIEANVMETVLRGMLVFDPEGEIPKKMAEKRLE